MRQRFSRIELILANYYVTDRLLMVPADRLGHSRHRCCDHHRDLEGHGVVGDLHLVVADEQLHLGGHHIGVFVDGDLVHGGIVLLLLLLLGLLLFLRRHEPEFLPIYIL